jgi:hypothetical protein
MMREEVRRLHELGLSRIEIARTLGVSKGTVGFHVRRLGLPIDPRFGRRFDWVKIRKAYEEGASVRECMARFGFSSHAWNLAARRGLINPRPTAMPIEDLLVVGRRTNRSHLKGRLLKEGLKQNICEECGLMDWRGMPLNMALHHVNGEGTDNRLENLVLLCPNCHAQTANYGGRGVKRRLAKRRLRLVKSA